MPGYIFPVMHECLPHFNRFYCMLSENLYMEKIIVVAIVSPSVHLAMLYYGNAQLQFHTCVIFHTWFHATFVCEMQIFAV